MKKFLVAICAVALFLTLSACESSQESSGKLNVVSTIGMINDVVRAVGGEYVHPVGLMGPGVDPHLYKASEGDVRKLSKADMIFYNGLHLEAKMGDVLVKMASRTTVIPVTERIPESKLMSPPEFEGFHDPHVWFDITLWMSVVERIRDGLIEKDPANKAYYKQNARAYVDALKSLDTWVREQVKQVPKDSRVLVTAHDAFGYFGAAYGFEVMGLQGISTETEAGTKDVQDLAKTIVNRKIKAMFVESSVPVRNIKAVQASARSKGWNVDIGGELFADAMGDDGTEEGTYIGMIQHNVMTIVEALLGHTHGDGHHHAH